MKEAQETQQYKYFAFISYSSKDAEWGKKVQRKLEHYRMPAMLCSERGWKRTPIKPVFFAPTDIQPGPLSEELQERLKASRNLIVICSPNSAQSEWVGREIEFFHSIGRTKSIHFFIIDGIPHSGNPETECFNPIIKKLGLPEILGANIHERISRWPWINRERAYVQLVSKLLDVEFDSIWQRHKRRMTRRVVTWSVGTVAVLATIIGVWSKSQPVDVEMRLNEASVHNESLPPLEDAVITMTLENETKRDTIHSIDDAAMFKNVPHRFMGKDVHVTVRCKDFIDVDTTLRLAEEMSIDIRRNPDVYGKIQFTLWNEDGEGVPDMPLTIAGYDVVSDSNGNVRLFVPLEEQQEKYHATAKDSSALSKGGLISMPCGEDFVITIAE